MPVGREPVGSATTPETVLVAVAILTTLPVSRLVTYRVLPLELIAIALGVVIAMVVDTAPVLVLTILTVLFSTLVTYSRVPSGFTARASGVGPTAIVPISVLLVVS